MNPQTKTPGWSTRLGITALATAVALIAAAAIANVPQPDASLDAQSAAFDGSVIMDRDAHSRAVAAAAEEGSYATGFVEFDNTGSIRDDGLGVLSETGNSEILD
jgi:hypothetical protein